MQDDPRRRRRSRRGRPRPTQAPAQPTPPPRSRHDDRPLPAPAGRSRRGRPRGRQERAAGDIRAGTACVILMDCREGEPDRTGAAAVFEGFFDFETGEPRRGGAGIPLLRVGPQEKVWGFECWWRADPARGGLTPTDQEELKVSKRLLRGLVRDSRRQRPLAVR